MASLEQNLLDLNTLVDRCQKKIEKNANKKDKMVGENQILQQQLDELKDLYQKLSIDDPFTFK